jgi:hypothetical protein
MEPGFHSSKETISYPISNREAYQSRIRFVVKEASSLREDVDSILKAPVAQAVVDDPALEAEIEAQAALDKERQITKLAQAGPTYTQSETAPVIALFAPISMQFNDAVDYNNQINLGVLGADTAAAVGGGKTLGAAAIGAIGKTGTSIVDLFKTGIDIGSETAAVAATRFTPTDFGKNIVRAITQTTANPNTRILFNNVNIRQFNFTFKMIPTSREESVAIENIVKHFRKEMYPKLIAANVGFKFPNAFGIEVKHRNSEVKFQKFPDCFLQAVDTVYNSTSGVFHAEGYPSEVDMTLRFTEMRQLNKADIEEGL